MPFGYVLRQIVALMNILTILEDLGDQNILREVWTWKRPFIPSIYEYITYDDDLRELGHVEMVTFDVIMFSIDGYMDWPRNWMQKVDDINITVYDGKKQSSPLSNKDRLLRTLMIGAKKNVSSVSQLFNQSKCVAYADFKFICLTIVHRMGKEWMSTETPGTLGYESLIGMGVFTDTEEDIVLFENVPYVSDVTSIKIGRPVRAQRDWYNGHKRDHTADFITYHDGWGRVRKAGGPAPGSYNDIQQIKKSPFTTNPERFLLPEHWVISDLAYYFIGYPYLTKIHFQDSYTIEENAFNGQLNKVRVISENWYCRFKTVFPIFRFYTFKLKDIGFIFRAFAIICNVIITVQDPLRTEFKSN